MATVTKWTPFGVALDITATAGTVTRKTSATQFEVPISVSWKTTWDNAKTKYGMKITSHSNTYTITPFDGVSRESGSGSFTGKYSISENGATTRSITVTFTNFNTDNDDSASKSITLSVNVPAWTSYKVNYSANGGTGAPSSQTKWKGQALTLSGTKPTRTGHSFIGWATSATATSKTYSSGGRYTNDSDVTLYAVWKANTYTVKYNANGGTGAPGNQTKTYGQTLTLSSTKPTRTNYTFKGWATSASATSAKYSAGSSYTANSAVTLYAVWELTYVKPTITSLKATRCNSSGTTDDNGKYAKVSFVWTSSIGASSVVISWAGTEGSATGSTTVATSGTGSTVSKVVGGRFDVETSYTFTVTVTDSKDSVARSVTMSGTEFHMDFGENSVAIGKPAETLLGTNGSKFKSLDVKWRSKFRECVCVGDKLYYHDGNQGIFLSWEGFMQLQRTSAQGYHPYIGFYLDDATVDGGQIRLNSSTKQLEFLNAVGYHFDGDIVINNNEPIMGLTSSGLAYNVFQPKNDSDNTVIGYDNYANNNGNTNMYGKDIYLGVSNIPTPGAYRPYRRHGDSITLTLRTAGYITNSGKDLSFWIPFAEPIIGSPSVTVASGTGFILRQGDKYTHGSTASDGVSPVSYEATATQYNGVYIKAVFSNTANVINNDSIGIYWNGTITFS